MKPANNVDAEDATSQVDDVPVPLQTVQPEQERRTRSKKEMDLKSQWRRGRRSTSGLGSAHSRISTLELSSSDCNGIASPRHMPLDFPDREPATSPLSHPSFQKLLGILGRKWNQMIKT
jgi:hypothetical protein